MSDEWRAVADASRGVVAAVWTQDLGALDDAFSRLATARQALAEAADAQAANG
jgi:hypothetical protein